MKKQLAQSKLHYHFMSLNRHYKRLLMLMADLVALPLALWSAYALRFADWWPEKYLYPAAWLFVFVPLVGIGIFIKLGLYRAVVRYMGAQAIWMVATGVALLAVMLWAAAYLFRIDPFPRSIPINFALVAVVYVGGSRLLMRSYYHWLLKRFLTQEPVLIYGAGSSGVQLGKALSGTYELRCVGFVDDDEALWGSSVAGLRVYPPDEIAQVIEKKHISSILLAMPSANSRQRKRILDQLADFPVHVRTVPAMHEIVAGEALTTLRDIEIEDLLGRDPVPPIPSLLDASIRDKVVMVTGAGGSIGSEICRQVLNNQPKALVLYEMSEFALYSIEQELQQLALTENLTLPIYPVLGSVCDAERVQQVLAQFQVQTIYHAAAYKHVPLVEHNIFEGVRNNSLGTQTLAEAALAQGVERFVLISTDKAVRPTNVMGATKRLAELILQDLAERSSSTVFAMVRFGNVLGSSGSVVPLFRQQIQAGGPITVTHPEITRYFMTIPEAACLVIQAGSMAEGGDVFVLDMGEPVKIVDLAKRMIRLLGHEERTASFPQGDIEITFSGLRPGEKLYEELLIGEDVIGTDHPKIMRALEELDAAELQQRLQAMQQAIQTHDHATARSVLQQTVKGFKPASPLVDWLAEVPVVTSTHKAVH